MRYSELAGKEIICIDEGIRLGVVDHTDLILNLRTGEVESIVIPWHGIKKIGRDLIIVDLASAQDYADVMRKIEEHPRRNKPPFFG